MQQIGHLNLNPRHSKSTLLTPVLHSLPLQWELTAQDTQHSVGSLRGGPTNVLFVPVVPKKYWEKPKDNDWLQDSETAADHFISSTSLWSMTSTVKCKMHCNWNSQNLELFSFLAHCKTALYAPTGLCWAMWLILDNDFNRICVISRLECLTDGLRPSKTLL